MGLAKGKSLRAICLKNCYLSCSGYPGREGRRSFGPGGSDCAALAMATATPQRPVLPDHDMICQYHALASPQWMTWRVARDGPPLHPRWSPV